MASWKVVLSSAEESKIEYTPFLQCRKFFAVDDSGSTAGAVLRQERAFVDAFRECHPNVGDAISLWGTNCDVPTRFDKINWHSGHGGTSPSSILRHSTALDTISKSDAWFLLTDGEIYDGDVHRLADLAHESGILNVPLVFLITGSRGSSPGTANISVGISFFASSRDTLILFKETQTGKIYVIAGKGCFAELGGPAGAQDLSNWNELPSFASEADFFSYCGKSGIKVVTSETREGSTGAIGLGPTWEEQHGSSVRVDLDALLKSGFLSDTDVVDILAEEAFDALAIACKTRKRLPDLRTFVQSQKIEQVAPKLEDRNGAAAIIAKMGDDVSGDERILLQKQLREAHARNRHDYQKTIADFSGSVAERNLRKRNQLVDAALRSLASIEAASFNADIIGRRSNRARRAETIDLNSNPTIDVAELDLEAASCKGYCLICCDEQVLSICFKEVDAENAEDNTTDFALNFPLAAGASTKNVNLISSQNICFQCALLNPGGMSIYKERLTAIIPVVQYCGSNKKYINDQLYSALTARLATGAAGVAQLFMSILAGVMKTKSWAGAGHDSSHTSDDEQHEAAQRRRAFQWMLDQLLQNTSTRETFNENGDWVKFPQALSWIAKDFESNGVASFAITYPAAGFDNLIALGQHVGAFSEDIISRMTTTKTLYSMAAKYLADLQIANQQKSGDEGRNTEKWKQKYLELIYQDFNGPLVPADHGEASIITDEQVFKQRMSACLAQTTTTSNIESTNHKTIMRKTQVLLFWLLFTQRNHCTAQTFFTRISHHEHLAPAILDPLLTVPTSEHQHVLLSIFAKHDANPINPSLTASHQTLIPFANPFGASVLHCGAATCNERFCTLDSSQEITPQDIEAIRKARTKHLVDVFGIRGRFERSDTGLPERAAAGRPPTSIHSNLHMSIVREWSTWVTDVREGIVAGGAERERFVAGVRRRLCEEGRGDIFNADIDRDTEALLPSFFAVLAKALRMEGGTEENIALYEHNFLRNSLETKIKWELEAPRG